MPNNPESQFDPNWSPDGNKIVFSGGSEPSSEIHVLDLTTHRVFTLPNSQGLWSPRWSPDGRYVPAFSADSKRLAVFDFRTQKWTDIAKGRMGWMNWSMDAQSLLLLDQGGTGP